MDPLAAVVAADAAGHQWLIGALVFLAVFGAAVTALRPIWRFLKAVARVPAVLEGVASEFSPNGGGSLRDSLDRLAHAMEMQTIAFEQHLAADESFSAFARARFEEHETFEKYTHQRFHDILNENQKILLLMSLPTTQRSEVAAKLLARRTDKTEEPK